MLRVIVIGFLLVILPHCVLAKAFDHSAWASLLEENVKETNGGKATLVDYQGFLAKRLLLDKYLAGLSAVPKSEFEAWSREEQLAFLINSYNGWTVSLILTKYPDLESIRDLGSLFRSPWKKEFVPLFGDTRSLDYIEHELIRGSGRYDEPRIHFAVNCASTGCPALSNEPYIGEILDSQLAEATSLFLQDRTRNRLRDGILEVSSIFKWYKQDFEQGWLGYWSLEQFFADHADDLALSPQEAALVREGQIQITFLDYDWNLNRVP